MGNIGKGVETEAFENQDTIISVEFGEQCKTIGIEAFNGCDKLKKINDNNIIETINERAFCDCTLLEKVIFDKVNDIGKESFSGCSSLTSVSIPTCETIGESAFKNCNKLKIVVKQNVQTQCQIKDSAFEGCVDLHTIYMDNCTHIGSKAFKNCKEIKEVRLNRCKSIGSEAFYGCENITQVNLSVCESIGTNAFSKCNNLKRVYIDNLPDNPCVLGNPNNNKVFCDCNLPTNKCNCDINFYFRTDTYNRILKDINNATNDNDWSSWKYYIDRIVPMPQAHQIIYTTSNNKSLDIDSIYFMSNDYINGKYGLIEFNIDIKNLDKETFTISNPEYLISITLPSKCESIGPNVFENCVNLENITTYSDLNKICSYAFKNCKSLKSFVIPNTVTYLEEGIFSGCENIENFEGRFVTYNGKAIVYKDKNNVNTLICVSPKDSTRKLNISKISANINRLGEECFCGCVNLRRIDIPSTVITINKNAFAKCKNLYEIYLLNAVYPYTVISRDIFGEDDPDSNILKNLKIFMPDSTRAINEYLRVWNRYKKYIYPTPGYNNIICFTNEEITPNTKIPMSLVNFAEHEYRYYKSASINNIPSGCFSENKNITDIIIGENITTIGSDAFKGCTDLEYIHLSDNTHTLGDRCFWECSKLTSIHIPSKLSRSGSRNIFIDCSNLKEFKEYEKKYVSNDNRCVISEDGETLMFFAPYGIPKYSIPDGVTKIGNSAFYGSQIETIDLRNVTNIDNYAFTNCTRLENISFEKINYIENYAFQNCTNLHGIKLSENIQRIGIYAFEGCVEIFLENNIPDSLKEIGEGAFKDCAKFRCSTGEGYPSLILNNIGTKINKCTFKNCTSLNGVIIGNNVKIIDEEAFFGCTGLEIITLSSNLNRINTDAFNNCIKLCKLSGEINLPNTVNYIGPSAFYNCNSIHNITLPSGLTEMGTNCFNFIPVAPPSPETIIITIPDILTNPPSFDSETSIPFGAYTIYNVKRQIKIPFELEYTYRNNNYWKKYINNFVTTGTDNLKLESCFRVYCNIDGLYIRFYRNIPYEWTGSTVFFSITDRTDKDVMTFGGVLILDPKLADKDSIPFSIRVGTVATQDDINYYKGKSLIIYNVISSSGKDLSDIYNGNPMSIGDDLNSDIIF